MDRSRSAIGSGERRRLRRWAIGSALIGLAALLSGLGWVAMAQSPTPDWINQVFPERQHDFGTVARGSVLRHRFPVQNRTNQPIRITSWKTKCGCTNVRVGAKVVPPGAMTTVEAVLDTTQYKGYKGSGLTLYLDRPQSVAVDLDLTCFIQDEVVVQPGNVDFGRVQRGTDPEAVIRLRYTGNQPDWRVVGMQTISAALQARMVEIGRSESGTVDYQLTARLEPDALRQGSFRDQITIETNDPDRPQIPLSVSAQVVSRVAVSPSVLTLGTLRPGQTVERTVLVRGQSPFQVVGAEPKQGPIRLKSEPPDQSRPFHQLTITLQAPENPGSNHAILEIETDLENEPPVRLTAFYTVRVQ